MDIILSAGLVYVVDIIDSLCTHCSTAHANYSSHNICPLCSDTETVVVDESEHDDVECFTHYCKTCYCLYTLRYVAAGKLDAWRSYGYKTEDFAAT